MNLFKIFKRGQKGFTLVELMVVMGIIAVLAAIVVPAVTGTKGPAEGAQFKGDANAVQSAAAKFNSDTVNASWPEAPIATTDTPSITGVYSAAEITAMLSYTNSSGVVTPRANGDKLTADNGYTAIKWTGNVVNIRLGSGALQAVNFVPDFIPKTPATDAAMSAKTNGLHVYVWLLKAGAATDASNRTVEIYKLNDLGTAYDKVVY